jgi:hypothetical protein
LKGDALTNVRTVINARTGACLMNASGPPGSGAGKFGFGKADFEGLAKVK